MEEDKFVVLGTNKNVHINEIYNASHTIHLNQDRLSRYNRALQLNKLSNGKEAYVVKTFVVDRGHCNGVELHCVTKNGIVFILNKDKYYANEDSLVTVLIARPKQVERLYEGIHKKPQEDIIKLCAKHQYAKQNY